MKRSGGPRASRTDQRLGAYFAVSEIRMIEGEREKSEGANGGEGRRFPGNGNASSPSLDDCRRCC